MRMKAKYIIVSLMAMAALASCEKDMMTYSGKDGIYFDTEGMVLDTVSVHWGLKNSDITEQEIQLKVKLIGNVADHDRNFSVEVETREGDDSAAVEGVHYEPIVKQYAIKAGEAETTISVKLKRSPELMNKPARFAIKLVENEELGFIYTRYGAQMVDDTTVVSRPLDYQRAIYIDENFPIPTWWPYYGEPYFGDWSMKKAILICDVMEIDRELWMKDIVTGLTAGYLKFAGRYMQRWLNDNPQYEDDGSLMVMGPESQGV